MDEPLSNLDAKLRNSTRIEIVRLQQRLGVTTIYVTHDQTEAMTMADRIVVMKEGVIQQVGTPQEIYAAPVNLFVASFIGTPQMNFIPGKLSETGFENESFRLSLPDALKAKLRSSIGKEVILACARRHWQSRRVSRRIPSRCVWRKWSIWAGTRLFMP